METTLSFTLIGYTLRHFAAKGATAICDELRARDFLLRENVVAVLSVDTSIWPSAGKPDPIELNDYTAVSEMWDSLDVVRHAHAKALKPCWGIALEVHEPAQSKARHVLSWGDLDRAGPESDWIALGCDVGDNWHPVSGLCDCGYDAAEVGTWRARWAKSLNEFGLFDDPIEALAFAAASDTRVKEHAPFFVYRLWLVAGSLDELKRGAGSKS